MQLPGAIEACKEFAKKNQLHAMVLTGILRSSSVFVFEKAGDHQKALFDVMVKILTTQVINVKEKVLGQPQPFAKFFTTDSQNDYKQSSRRPTLMTVFEEELAKQ